MAEIIIHIVTSIHSVGNIVLVVHIVVACAVCGGWKGIVGVVVEDCIVFMILTLDNFATIILILPKESIIRSEIAFWYYIWIHGDDDIVGVCFLKNGYDWLLKPSD